ncbi:ras guanine nucleotide exchange factor F-like isoform X1 [Mya arenaria]|uniref:ras guanine nucleotide exchange factor F-like isoform X1 n=1 Tax=Mya arenaria TaxID=6604 RepID=UPI0022E516A1|nr:ras guanine nucleotide exchange factor F-like isoform X1 [Mya arenaria]XP_052794577.1 ras guanine nucleotide exchange factor F-like isoform X1 [Mya arenaria]XP_052795394.1 ras guanine nucleotide exchange factor F-like isoform X1 [Mya arenaria]XP_052796195.1 ras guanine nucleotide exchange factor F-like isoform X1 [Mya arenaria]XP_052796993.1 ras guanine nucleotide exchange factor F-like isoform X1 [Mya arenaria]
MVRYQLCDPGNAVVMTTTPIESHVTCKCSQVKVTARSSFPQSRCKHACCLHENYVYAFAGKDGNIALKDFWRFNLGNKQWESVCFRGDLPHHLEGHTLVSCKKLMLIFGGEFGDSLTESSLWIINPDLGYIRKSNLDCGSDRPCIRRYHTAVVHDGAMYVYGGYIDMKGSSAELWKYNIDDEEWEQVKPKQSSRDQPGGRHGHSAVMFNKHMVIYGGSCDLVPKAELWSYSLGVRRWLRIKTKYGPPALSGHSAVVISQRMFVFGGENNREPVNSLWYFCFRSERWTQIMMNDSTPARMYHSALFVTPSAENNAIKASSMPYLQKKIAKMKLERPRSSPGERSSIASTSGYVRGLNFEKSESSRRINYQNQASERKVERPQVLTIDSSGSEDSLKVTPSPSENVADKSPLCPKKMDINYNALDILDRNSVNCGIDNPGVSDSTEELIRESSVQHLYQDGGQVDSISKGRSVFERSLSYTTELERSQKRSGIIERSYSGHVLHRLEVLENKLVNDVDKNYSSKKFRLDPELVIEDLEHVDCFPYDIEINYPSSNGKKFNLSISSESVLLPNECETMEIIELENCLSRTRSKSTGEVHTCFLDKQRSEKVTYSKETEEVQILAGLSHVIGESGQNVERRNDKNTLYDNIVKARRSDQRGVTVYPDTKQREVTGSHYSVDSRETTFMSSDGTEQGGPRLYQKKQQQANNRVIKPTVPQESPYILVIGGRDNQTVNFGIKPLQLWKLQVSPL